MAEDDGHQYPYSDEEDIEAFGSSHYTCYFGDVKWIKRNEPLERTLSCEGWFSYDDGYRTMRLSAWSRIGLFLGENTHVESLYLPTCFLTEDKFQALMQGMGRNQSLREVTFDDNPIGSLDSMRFLCSYLGSEHCNLLSLSLVGVDLGVDGLRALAPALRRTSVEKLDLSYNSFSSDSNNWEESSLVFYLPKVKRLYLRDCDIGIEGCRSLAFSLQKEETELSTLYLENNCINDECLFILADALAHNDLLSDLHLFGNEENISSVGLEHLFQSVCNTTSIQSTYDSNQSLVILTINFSSLDLPEHCDVQHRLYKMLTLNGNDGFLPCDRAKEKVMYAHFNCDENGFNMNPLLDLDVKIMPQLLAWFGEDILTHEEDEQIEKFRLFHHVVRHWNIPQLFGNPSAERVRIESRYTALETENFELDAKNCALEKTNKKLMAEIDRLKDSRASESDELKKEISRLQNKIISLEGRNRELESITLQCSKRKKL